MDDEEAQRIIFIGIYEDIGAFSLDPESLDSDKSSALEQFYDDMIAFGIIDGHSADGSMAEKIMELRASRCYITGLTPDDIQNIDLMKEIVNEL